MQLSFPRLCGQSLRPFALTETVGAVLAEEPVDALLDLGQLLGQTGLLLTPENCVLLFNIVKNKISQWHDERIKQSWQTNRCCKNKNASWFLTHLHFIVFMCCHSRKKSKNKNGRRTEIINLLPCLMPISADQMSSSAVHKTIVLSEGFFFIENKEINVRTLAAQNRRGWHDYYK